MIRRAGLLVLAAGALAVGCAAGSATPAPGVTLIGGAPSTLVAGQTWVLRMSARDGQMTAVLARSGSGVFVVRARRVAPNRYTARLALPRAGAWRLVARVGREFRPFARVRAVATYPLALPAQALADGDSLFVVERLGRDRILRVDLATGGVSVFSEAVPSPWGLARAANGDVLASGAAGIYSLGSGRLADVPASPIAADGAEVYYANEGEVGRVHAGSAEVLTEDVDAPHGLFVSAGAELFVSDSGRGRLIRVDRATGAIDVVATGLEQALGAIDDGAGGALVVEFGAGRLVDVHPDGTRSVVTSALRKPYALTRGADGAVYVVEDGELDRPGGGLARVDADATVTRLRLVPRWQP